MYVIYNSLIINNKIIYKFSWKLQFILSLLRFILSKIYDISKFKFDFNVKLKTFFNFNN